MRTPSWTLWRDDTGRPGWENMALDRTLLDLAVAEGSAFLRLYRWDRPTISFGRHEPALRRYDRKSIEAREIPCVRRPTGGRGVWHADELTYAVAAPTSWFDGGLQGAYRAIHSCLAEAVRSLGVLDVALAPRPDRPGPPLTAGACFERPAGGELTVAGRKLVGSAQLRAGNAFLQHGSLLLGGDQAPLRALSGSEAVATEIALGALLSRPVRFGEAADAVTRAAQARWGEAWSTADAERLLAAGVTHRGQYRDPAWTWRR